MPISNRERRKKAKARIMPASMRKICMVCHQVVAKRGIHDQEQAVDDVDQRRRHQTQTRGCSTKSEERDSRTQKSEKFDFAIGNRSWELRILSNRKLRLAFKSGFRFANPIFFRFRYDDVNTHKKLFGFARPIRTGPSPISSVSKKVIVPWNLQSCQEEAHCYREPFHLPCSMVSVKPV